MAPVGELVLGPPPWIPESKDMQDTYVKWCKICLAVNAHPPVYSKWSPSPLYIIVLGCVPRGNVCLPAAFPLQACSSGYLLRTPNRVLMGNSGLLSCSSFALARQSSWNCLGSDGKEKSPCVQYKGNCSQVVFVFVFFPKVGWICGC